MKKLLFVLLVAAVAAAAWVRESPYYALWQVEQGIAARDPVVVERHVDLDAITKAATLAIAELAREQAGASGNDLGSALFGAFAQGLADQVGQALAPTAVAEMRRAIQEGRMHRGLGPFVVNDGLGALGSVDRHGEGTALVTLNGRCEQNDASLTLVMERKQNGPVFGYPSTWVVVGVDKASVQALAKVCKRP